LDWAIPNFYHYGSTRVKTVELPVTTGDNLSFVTTCLVWLRNKTLGEAGQNSVKNLNFEVENSEFLELLFKFSEYLFY
jgi:hypothetical protein